MPGCLSLFFSGASSCFQLSDGHLSQAEYFKIPLVLQKFKIFVCSYVLPACVVYHMGTAPGGQERLLVSPGTGGEMIVHLHSM